jgi:hypothetical protein
VIKVSGVRDSLVRATRLYNTLLIFHRIVSILIKTIIIVRHTHAHLLSPQALLQLILDLLFLDGLSTSLLNPLRRQLLQLALSLAGVKLICKQASLDLRCRLVSPLLGDIVESHTRASSGDVGIRHA